MSSGADTTAGAVGDQEHQRLADCWVLFQVMWTAAVLFHLAGNPTLAPEWGRAVLGATALLSLTRPRQPWAGAPMAGAVLVNVWLEAPVLGNHWLLHGFIAVLVIAATLVGGGDPAASTGRFIGPARLTLLVFYAFAAFAKLNSDFFEPAVSCAVFYLGESADSWGVALDGLSRPVEVAIAVAVAAVELSVPVLLVMRRTRHVGVVLALVFHYVLAVDRSHQFADFSSLLAALFVLFLAPTAASEVVREFRRAGRRLAERVDPELVRAALILLLAAVVLYASGPRSWGAPPVLRELAVLTWLVYGAVLTLVVLVAVRRSPGAHPALVPRGTPAWLLLVPVVALLNGLTPYLEIKSSASWNMYANLAVVHGDSNHFLVRRAFPLTDGHERLVQITRSTDRPLRFYVDSPWLVPEQQLLDYLADRDGAIVRGLVDGEEVRYAGGEGSARPIWQQKFQVFRAVDAEGSTSCQPSFGPAR